MNKMSTVFRLILFSLVILTIVSCGKRKQRDVRKLNWYEITTEARGDEIRVLVPAEELDAWKARFPLEGDSILKRLSMTIKLEGYAKSALLDSLNSATTASLVALRGEDLKNALQFQWLFGPYDRLMPISKALDTSSDLFRYSQGVLSQGYAVPIKANEIDSLEVAFFAIPLEAESKAGSLVLLNEMLAQ
jgi:hypothetical protein